MGALHTSSQIREILASVSTPQIKRRCSSFRGDITHAKGAEAATEGGLAAADAAYP